MQLFYFSKTLNAIDFAVKEAIVIGELLQMTVGLFICSAGESFESGKVFRQQGYEGYTQASVPQTSESQQSLEGSWFQLIEVNFTCKQLREELGDHGIQPAPKTRKSELVKILVEGSV